jgi:hypothetical protein
LLTHRRFSDALSNVSGEFYFCGGTCWLRISLSGLASPEDTPLSSLKMLLEQVALLAHAFEQEMWQMTPPN